MSAPTATPDTTELGATAKGTQSPRDNATRQEAPAGTPVYTPGTHGTHPHFATTVPLSYVIEQKLRNHSIIVLIFGICGLAMVLPLVGSIVAWLWGNNILTEARMNGIHEEVVSLAKIGRLLGIIGVILVAAIPVIVLVATLFALAIAAIFGIPFVF